MAKQDKSEQKLNIEQLNAIDLLVTARPTKKLPTW